MAAARRSVRGSDGGVHGERRHEKHDENQNEKHDDPQPRDRPSDRCAPPGWRRPVGGGIAGGIAGGDIAGGDIVRRGFVGGEFVGQLTVPEPNEAASRRTKTGQRRNHRVGPLRFNDEELRAVKLAADRMGLSIGAYATEAVVRVAEAELDGLPVDRERLAELRAIREVAARIEADLGRSGADPFDRLVTMLSELTETLRFFRSMAL